MSHEAVTWAVKVLEHEHHRDMDTGPRFVLLILANRADETGYLFPSANWIMARTKYSERSVRNFVKEILHRGLMKKTPRRREDGGQTSNEYQLAMDQYVLHLIAPGATNAGGVATVAPGAASAAPQGVHGLQGAGAVAAPQETLRKRPEEKKKTLGGKPPLDHEFEAAWAKYPKRSGNNPKLDARKAWDARLADGTPSSSMAAGVSRYSVWCATTGKIGTEYVLRASTFFGPSKPFEQDFDAPATPGAPIRPVMVCADCKSPLGSSWTLRDRGRVCAKCFAAESTGSPRAVPA